MTVGVTGHQLRDGIDWGWVRTSTQSELCKLTGVDLALTSLAVGTDQIFAEVALSLAIPVRAIIPFPNYERCFNEEGLSRYRYLLHKCEVLILNGPGDDEARFFEAGKTIVRMSDLILAIWDGKTAAGKGGTGDVVHFCRNAGRQLIHINPITRSIGSI